MSDADGPTPDNEINPNQVRFAVLEPILLAHKLVALVEGLDARGHMSAFHDGVTVDEFAQQTRSDSDSARAVLGALRAGEVIAAEGRGFRLTPTWAALLSDRAFTPFGSVVRGARATADLLRHSTAALDYWEVDPADRLALAAGVSPDPMAGGFVKMLQQDAASGDRFASAVSRAGRYLELGCGLAGAGLSTLLAFPGVRMVGVELSQDLAAEAERRAVTVGVADRFTVVCADAGDFTDPEPFDVGFWSQFFFPEHTRAAARRTLFEQVRSGGTVAVPVRFAELDQDVGSPQVLDHALFRVMAQSWEVPDRSPEQVAGELEETGFRDIEIKTRIPTRFLVTAKRP